MAVRLYSVKIKRRNRAAQYVLLGLLAVVTLTVAAFALTTGSSQPLLPQHEPIQPGMYKQP